MMLAECGGIQEQQQLSRKESVVKEQPRLIHESENAKTAPKGTSHPDQLGPVTSRSPARAPQRPPTHPPTSPHNTGRHVAAASRAAASGSRWRTPRSRCSDSSCASPRLALYALPALAPHCTHHDRPCKQASGYFLSSLPPPGRGAAASSSPPAPVISPVFALRSDYQAFAVICMAVVWEITANRARNPSSQILDLPKYSY